MVFPARHSGVEPGGRCRDERDTLSSVGSRTEERDPRRYVVAPCGLQGVAGRGPTHRDSWVTGQDVPCPALPTFVGGPGVYRAYECWARCARTICLRGSNRQRHRRAPDRKSTRLNSSHVAISYAVFCLKKKTHHK